MPDNLHQIVNDCKPYQYTLWLKHSPQYNYINAYNLAYLSRLAYSDVFLPERETGKKSNGQKIDRDFADFIQKSHHVIPCMGWITPAYRPIKLSSIKTVGNDISSGLTPFVEIVPEGEGINRWLEEGTGYVHEKVNAFTEVNQYPQTIHVRAPLTVDALFYTDAKRAVISIRGTQETISDLIGTDAGAQQITSPHGLAGKVHEGFHEHFDKILNSPQFDFFINTVKNEGKALFVTGHSLGGAVATLLAAFFSQQQGKDGQPLKPLLYTFGSPRAGNSDFVSAYSGKFPHFRHVNAGDPIPLLPGRWVDGGKAEAAKGAAQSVGTKIAISAAKGGLSGIKKNPKGLVLSAVVGAMRGIYNWASKKYTHHGDVCHIIGINDESKMIMPFSSHNISQKQYIEHQLNQEKINSLRNKIARGGDFTPDSPLVHPDSIEAQMGALTTDDALNVLKQEIYELRRRNYEIEQEYDRVDKKSKIATAPFAISNHGMDAYLANLSNITDHLWTFYRIDNNCKKLSFQQCAEHNLATFTTQFKQELNSHITETQKKIDELQFQSSMMMNKVPTEPIDYSIDRDIWKLSEVKRSLKADVAEIEKIEQTPIENHFLYAIRTKDHDAVAQLDLLVGKQPKFV